MKLLKKLFLIIFLCATGMSMPSAFGQAVEEGNIIIDVTYGFPNLNTTFLKTTYASSGLEEDVNVSGIGPVGLRFEYMVSDKLGVGAEVNYAGTKLNYREGTYTYEVTNPRTRIMVRLQYHFIDNDQVDAYIMGGAGYKLSNTSFSSNDPSYTDEEIPNLFPIALRVGGGMRYFFTDNLGLNLELGLGGGGLIAAGISAKF